MNNRLMREFEEFEGLSGVPIDDTIIEDDDDDPSFRPANASLLTSNDIYYEVNYFKHFIIIIIFADLII